MKKCRVGERIDMGQNPHLELNWAEKSHENKYKLGFGPELDILEPYRMWKEKNVDRQISINRSPARDYEKITKEH